MAISRSMSSISLPMQTLERYGIFLLAGYFLLMALLRPIISGALEFDEAEQMLHTQRLLIGYGAQPPLFTWLLYGLFAIDGPSLLWLALLKNSLMFLTTLFLFLASKRIFNTGLPALAVALSFFLIPQFVWESQRTLTHTVLATTCSSALFYIFVRAEQDRRLSDYIAIGLALGLGVLSKYSFALYAALLLGAALLTASLRVVLLDRRFLLSLLIAGVIILPHSLWVLGHWQLASTSTLEKLQMVQDTSLFISFFQGWGSLAWAIFLFMSPLWVILLWAAFSPRESPYKVNVVWLTFFKNYGLLFVISMSLFILFTHATHFREHWLQPFLVLAPLASLLFWPVSSLGARRVIVSGLVLMTLAFVLLNTRALLGGALDKPSKLNLPIENISEDLRTQGWTGGLVLTQSIHLAGGLRLHLPESTVHLVSSEFRPIDELRSACSVLMVWDSPNQSEPPAELSMAFANIFSKEWSTLPHSYAALSTTVLHGKRIYTLHTMKISQSCSP